MAEDNNSSSKDNNNSNENNPWDADDFDPDEKMLSKETTLIEEVDDDFLMVVDDEQEEHDSALGLLPDHDEVARRETLPPVFQEREERAPQSPTPNQHQIPFDDAYRGDYHHNVTPEQIPPQQIEFAYMNELEIQCRKTRRKLATSMRRSDMTRSEIKRQRLLSGGFSNLSFDSDDGCDSDYLRKHRSKHMDVEHTRRKLFRFLSDSN